MNKIFKIVVLALMLIGVALTAYVFIDKGSDASVNLLLYWTYAMVGLAIVTILASIGMDAKVNPKTLVRIAIVIVGAVVIVGVAFLLAPGTPAVGYVGEPVSDGALKLTDTILNLTYFAVVVAIAAICYGLVVDKIKK